MNSIELQEGLELIFDKEKTELKEYNTFTRIQKIRENEHFSSHFITNYPNSEKLVNFYHFLDNEDDKILFIKLLQKEIIESDEDEIEEIQKSPRESTYNGLSKLCFYSLLKLGFSNEALDSLIKRKKRSYGIMTILIGIDLKDYFTIEQLTKLLSKIDNLKTDKTYFKNLILRRIKSTRFEKFEQKIKFKNIEINQDKKSVSEKIAFFGFDKKYNTLLAEIDDFLNDETHKSINSGMINNLRAFMCDLFIDIAKKISQEKNEEIPRLPNHQEIGNARNYLKKKLALSDKDDKFINSFVEILHHEGGHAFLSEKEYFRLARNIAIEITLFVLSRCEKQ